jgi:hypothetical protein
MKQILDKTGRRWYKIKQVMHKRGHALFEIKGSGTCCAKGSYNLIKFFA